MHLQQTYIDLVSPAYHLWQTGVFLYEPRIDAYETTYSYDDKQITESTYFDGEKQFYFVSKYNSEGYITSYSAFTAENEIMRSAKFEYDDHNNVIKLVRTNSDDEISISYAPDREYDANGRITSETYYSNIDYFSPTTLDIYKTQYL